MDWIAIIAAVLAALATIFGTTSEERVLRFMERVCPTTIAYVNAVGGVVEAVRPIDPDANIRRYLQTGRLICDTYGGTAEAVEAVAPAE